MNKPEVWDFDQLLASDLNNAAVWTLSFLSGKVRERFPLPIVEASGTPPQGLTTVLVVGGGVLIDKAKVWRKQNNPEMRLIAVPSIWGSGAENSSIAVLNEGGKKVIFMGDQFLPDIRVVWGELAKELPSDLVRFACGDVWAHALEGFLSPVANDEVRTELGKVIMELEEMHVDNDPAWFEISARTCSGQAASSVGLIHGIAHTLEGILKQKDPGRYIGHAQLCATYLWPVFSLNIKLTDKIDALFSRYGLHESKAIDILKVFFDEDFYSFTIPVLRDNWRQVLRDPSSRTNCALVRPSHLSHFVDRQFLP